MSKGFWSFDINTGELKPYKEKKKNTRARSQTESVKSNLARYVMYGVSQFMSYNDTFEMSVDLIQLLSVFANSTQADITFFSKLLKHARLHGTNKKVVILGLVVLSASENDFAKNKFREIFNDIILDYEDLVEFVNIINSKSIRGYGKLIQNAVTDWILRLSPHEVLKFSQYDRSPLIVDGQHIDSVNLADIVALSHVKPVDGADKGMLQWLMTKKVEEDTPALIKASSTIKSEARFTDTSLELIKNNNIPIDAIKDKVTNISAWQHLFMNATFDEILNNIRLFYRRKVFSDATCLKRAIEIFSDKQTIENSRLYPHKFTDAYDLVSNGPVKLLGALEKASELSLNNIPDINAHTAIFVDQSYVMEEFQVQKDLMSTARTSINTLAAIIAKKSTESTIIPFSKKAELIHADKNKSIIALANEISTYDVSLTRNANFVELFRFLYESRLTPTKLIFISNGTYWHEILRSDTNLNKYFSDYLSDVNSTSPQMIFFNAAKEYSGIFSHSLPNSTFVFGWSDNLIKFLFDLLNGINTSQVIDRI